jgi:hypothetical protein
MRAGGAVVPTNEFPQLIVDGRKAHFLEDEDDDENEYDWCR